MKFDVYKNNETVSARHAEWDTPSLYHVFIHNDDFTPMEFVVGILEKLFYMDRRTATETMFTAHMQGKAICGTFSKDCAETKIAQVIDHSRLHEHPLICSMETA